MRAYIHAQYRLYRRIVDCISLRDSLACFIRTKNIGIFVLTSEIRIDIIGTPYQPLLATVQEPMHDNVHIYCVLI